MKYGEKEIVEFDIEKDLEIWWEIFMTKKSFENILKNENAEVDEDKKEIKSEITRSDTINKTKRVKIENENIRNI